MCTRQLEAWGKKDKTFLRNLSDVSQIAKEEQV